MLIFSCIVPTLTDDPRRESRTHRCQRINIRKTVRHPQLGSPKPRLSLRRAFCPPKQHTDTTPEKDKRLYTTHRASSPLYARKKDASPAESCRFLPSVKVKNLFYPLQTSSTLFLTNLIILLGRS